MRIFSATLALLCLSSPACAGEVKLFTDTGNDPHIQTLEETNGTYFYETEVGEVVSTIALDPETAEQVTAIEYMHTTSWAVGEDGPWRPIPDSDTRSGWNPIPLSSLKDGRLTPPENHEEQGVSLPKDTIEKAKLSFLNDKDVMEPERWTALLDKCDGSDASPCYSYFSENTIRYTLKDGKSLVVKISYPGGC